MNWFRDLFQQLEFGARSSDWRGLRDAYIKKHNKCAVCGTHRKLEVHHINPYHLYPELELEVNNLMTLCRDHHFLFGHLMSWGAYNPNCIEDCHLFSNKINNRAYD